MTNKRNEIVKLIKRYLNLMDRINKFRIAGDDPPDDLLEEFTDIESIFSIMSKAFS